MGHEAAGAPVACPPTGGLPRCGFTFPERDSSVIEGFVEGEKESVSPVESRSVCIALTADNLCLTFGRVKCGRECLPTQPKLNKWQEDAALFGGAKEQGSDAPSPNAQALSQTH